MWSFTLLTQSEWHRLENAPVCLLSPLQSPFWCPQKGQGQQSEQRNTLKASVLCHAATSNRQVNITLNFPEIVPKQWVYPLQAQAISLCPFLLHSQMVGKCGFILHKVLSLIFIHNHQQNNLIYVGDYNDSKCCVGGIIYASLSMLACRIKYPILVKC